ncbi:MAG: VWA domain-containing protein [Weeksellaceae bacterium]|jgi:Ca-activated chloride channel family protein|nr:VWA domain-containing protein [Weeksellaceae bacterium]
MDWAHLENSIWLFTLPIFIGLALYVYRWRMRARKKFADEELIQRLFPAAKKSYYGLKVVLVSLSLLFSILALMDPLMGEEKTQIKREGTDIIYALDLSNSMYAEDIAPNRLGNAKKIIQESLHQLGGDRVGLIVFAGDAYSISPMTHDYGAIESYIEMASPELISAQGTNLFSVVQKAVEMFDNAPTTGKLLVILSDGEDNEKSISKAIKLAEESKIHIATMGIGTKNGAPIPIHNSSFQDYKTDRQGDVVISRFDEETLKSLAKSTKGKYIYVEDFGNAIEELHTFLNNLDKNVQDIQFSSEKKHIFQYFLVIAFVLLFIDTLTTEHKVFNI